MGLHPLDAAAYGRAKPWARRTSLQRGELLTCGLAASTLPAEGGVSHSEAGLGSVPPCSPYTAIEGGWYEGSLGQSQEAWWGQLPANSSYSVERLWGSLLYHPHTQTLPKSCFLILKYLPSDLSIPLHLLTQMTPTVSPASTPPVSPPHICPPHRSRKECPQFRIWPSASL